MKVINVVFAVVLTAGLLLVASKASRGKPEYVSYRDNGYFFQTTTVPKFAENAKARLEFNIAGVTSPNLRPVLRCARSEHDNLADVEKYSSYPLVLSDSSTGAYFGEVSTGPRGGRLQYYVQVLDASGEAKATFMAPGWRPFVLKYFGNVPVTVLVSHIAFMFVTVFCVAMASLQAIGVIRGVSYAQPMLKWLLAAVASAFVGGLPLGIAMNWYAFGATWEAVPFGTDATDNKTQLLLVYLAFATLAGLGTLTNHTRGRDIFSYRVLGWFGASSIVIMLLIYLIPHSIQFGRTTTFAVCYGFMGIWVAIYLLGWLSCRRSEPRVIYRPPMQKVGS